MAKNESGNEVVALLKRKAPAFSRLPPKDQQEIVSIVVRQQTSYSGPIPPADELKRYSEVVNDGAERIMKAFETQSEHRRSIEKVVISSQQQRSDRGQWMGLIVAMSTIGSAVFLAYSGHDAVAGVLGGGTVLGLVSVFVIGRRQQSEDLEKKR
ncbi:MAG: DUF2335 domain-containing protein [Opitutales bacterium]|nr:DUF2335 domain-containing protein [Opitutales bacterium]